MRYHAKANNKDLRRVGCVFQDDAFSEESQETVVAVENWKSVMTELHEKKIKGTLQCNAPRKIDSSFDSGIQQEYNSDNDEVSHSICMTLNRLVELSKEQQIYLSHSESLNSIVNIDQPPLVQFDPAKRLKSIDCLSMKSNTSEANNLVEEVIMKNSCSTENAIGHTVLGKFSDVSSVDINRSHVSGSTPNLNSISNATTELPQSKVSARRACIQSSMKTKLGPLSLKCNSEIVVAIDIGTTYSGFVYAIDEFTSCCTHVTKNFNGSQTKKMPSILLLNSRTEFHSFGHEALEYFLNIEHNAAASYSQWLLFEKFKTQLMNVTEINRECRIKATNGISIPALMVYTRTLNYFKCLALQELSIVLQKTIKRDQVRWVVTIPVIWSIPGKMFIQEAAFSAGLCTAETSTRLTVIYECEAAAAWCNILHWNSLSRDQSIHQLDSYYFLVVNCGGGTLDVTVHQTKNRNSCVISEIQKSSKIIHNSSSVNEEFARLLISILGKKFMNLLQLEKPASVIDLMYQFEVTKCTPTCANKSADICCKWYLSEFYHKITGKQLSQCVTNFDHENVTWHENEILRLDAEILRLLFQPLIGKIIQFIQRILQTRKERKISRIYFTGGLVRSPVFQQELKNHFDDTSSIIFVQNEAELCALKGAVYKFGLENFKYTKMNHSYGIGVIKEFEDEIHPLEKLVIKDGRKWCCDLLDWLVRKDQILQEGEVILKRYTPTTSHQSCIVINIYAVEHDDSKFVTDNGVHSYGVLRLSTTPTDKIIQHEILLQLIFTGDEFVVNALDTLTGRCDQIQLDNLSYL